MKIKHRTPKISRVHHEISYSSINKFHDAINLIYKGYIDSILIKKVFSNEKMKHVCKKLKDKYKFMSPADYGYTLGAPLIADGKKSSFSKIKEYQQHLQYLFDEDSFENRIESLLKKMSGNRNISIFNEGKGKQYAPATFRLIKPGSCLLIHRGNEYIDHSVFSNLSKEVSIRNHLSYFLVIDPPDCGGELYLYDIPDDKIYLSQDKLNFNTCKIHIINPNAGDIVIFHGGCIYHKINKISGKKNRISLGGFIGISKNNKKIYYWS